ncbi:MAG: Glycosyl transferase [Nitrospira sp.]|nr:MAG: Glycosyl transferase [Nitrospira sp.]
MKVSLIVATVGRTAELHRLFTSLEAQTYKDFELIVIDQNQDDRLNHVIAPFQDRMTIIHRTSPLGVSRARNEGLKRMTGDIVGFPDDDCWYPPDLLQHVIRLLEQHHCDGVTGRVIVHGEANVYAKFDDAAGPVSVTNVWRRTCAVTMFFKRRVVDTIGGFDETMGPGAGTLWAGGEDIDYPVRAVKAGFNILYRPEIHVFHPNPFDQGWETMANRAYLYGAGIGRVWKKHGFPRWVVAYYLLRPLGGAFVGLLTGEWPKTKYHWNALCGRFRGWRSTL